MPRTSRLEGDDPLPGMAGGDGGEVEWAVASQTLRVGHAMQNANPL